MYIAELTIENFRCFGEGSQALTLHLSPGLTALVGENDTGKTAVVDALRLVLGTRDQEYFRIQESDFHCPGSGATRATEIRIRCQFRNLTTDDKGAFAEYLTYVQHRGNHDAELYVNCTVRSAIGARNARRLFSVDIRSGKTADGPALDLAARNLLQATYLRPLRDAARAMAAGRSSRLSQILQHTKEVKESGQDYDPTVQVTDVEKLSVLGVGDYASALLREREGIKKARGRLNQDYLSPLSFAGSGLIADINVSAAADGETRLRQLLEKLELELQGTQGTQGSNVVANRGLGSNNVLFMACELLLLGAEEEGFPLLLIEEPEAHLHPQRQLRLVEFLQSQAEDIRSDGQSIQVIVTTHSPLVGSVIKLGNLVIMEGGNAFPLQHGMTELSASDYRFLERFLDATKANLFFARGVAIVEGDAENILLPALAEMIGRSFTDYGVSIVNVGGTGLRRFARIFLRKDVQTDGLIGVPVACVADLDVAPDCAPRIIGRIRTGENIPSKKDRRWRIKSDFTEAELEGFRRAKREVARDQNVETFVSDEWTLEYDLAYAGLAIDVWVAAHLAKDDDLIHSGVKTRSDVASAAEASFQRISENKTREVVASSVYAVFTKGKRVSKSISAQYLAERLDRRITDGHLSRNELRAALPRYLLSAIEFVTRASVPGARN